MPVLGDILSNEKKLDLSDFFKTNENEEKAYITIIKMPVILKEKMQLLTLQKMDKKTADSMIDALAKIDKKPEDVEKMTDTEKAKLFLNMETNFEEKSKLLLLTNEVKAAVFKNCIHPDKHNFYKDKLNKKKVAVNDFEIWNKTGNEKLVKFIYDEINSFSNDFFFYQNGQAKFDGQ